MNAVACLFAGPSLTAGVEGPAIRRLPPAGQGDVYRAARAGARIIGLVDGVFETRQSVWHREILWALQRGVHVLGAGSMGALRAAELCDYGMEGVGTVFAAFREGVLEDDDEVALIHGPPDAGGHCRPLCEAMVNIRATVAEAFEAGLVSMATADALVLAAKRTFYKERDYMRAVARARDDGADLDELDAFRTWLARGAVDLKGEDARSLVSRMHTLLRTGEAGPSPQWHFEYPTKWDALVDGFRAAPGLRDVTGLTDEPTAAILEEVKLQPGLWAEVWPRAVLRAVAGQPPVRDDAMPGAEARERAERGIWMRTGVTSREQARAWLARNRVPPQRFPDLRLSEARVQQLEHTHAAAALAAVTDELRCTGRYEALLGRALRKQSCLGQGPGPSRRLLGLDDAALFAWFCGRMGLDATFDAAETLALDMGFRDVNDLLAALAREHAFVQADR